MLQTIHKEDGRLVFADENHFYQVYDQLNLVIEQNLENAILSSALLTDSQINTYLDSIEFNDYAPLDSFCSTLSFISAFNSYYDSLSKIIASDTFSIQMLDQYPTSDPIMMSLLNPDWEVKIGDSIIVFSRPLICLGSPNCCIIGRGFNEASFNNGTRRVVVIVDVTPSIGLVGLPVAHIFRTEVRSYARTNGRWELRRENLNTNHSWRATSQNCNEIAWLGGSRSANNRSTLVHSKWHWYGSFTPFFVPKKCTEGASAIGAAGQNQVSVCVSY